MTNQSRIRWTWQAACVVAAMTMILICALIASSLWKEKLPAMQRLDLLTAVICRWSWTTAMRARLKNTIFGA